MIPSNEKAAGTRTLFLIQIFATLSYSILYSTLVLYITKGLKLDNTTATTITASFVAFNYALHLVGGFVSGRLFTHRTLFFVGMILQAAGCAVISFFHLYWGLAIYLSGAGLNVTCINCILTQFFSPHDKRRERAFLWNYSGMNLGFLIGFILSGFFELGENYKLLFLLGGASNLLTAIIVLIRWKILKDRKTHFILMSKKRRSTFRIFGFLLIAAIIVSLRWLVKNSSFSNNVIIIAGVLMLFMVMFFAIRQPTILAREKIWAYLVLSFMSLIFWTLYMTAPMGLTIFIENNVNREIFNFTFPPQWVLNINAIIIIIGGPSMAFLYKRLRKKGLNISIPLQFTLSLFLIGLGFVVLPIGINFAGPKGFVGFNWIILSYILQSIGELLISPIGYAMIGQLIPHKLQGIMMGVWMMITGVAAVIANVFSKMAIGTAGITDPLVTNSSFSKTFNILGISTIAAGIIMLCLIPFLNKLIKEKKHPTESSSIPI